MPAGKALSRFRGLPSSAMVSKEKVRANGDFDDLPPRPPRMRQSRLPLRRLPRPSGARMAEPRQLRPPIRQQLPGRAPGADYVTGGCPKHVSNFDNSGGGGSLSLLRAVFGFDP